MFSAVSFPLLPLIVANVAYLREPLNILVSQGVTSLYLARSRPDFDGAFLMASRLMQENWIELIELGGISIVTSFDFVQFTL